MFSKLVFYPIKTETADALPTYSAGIKLYNGTKTNNISLEITQNKVTQERKADNQIEKSTKVTDYSATLVVYDVDKTGLESVMGYQKDADGSFTIQPNKEKTKFGVFFETEDDGVKVQHYLYKVEIGDMNESYTTDDKTTIPTCTITLNGSLVSVSSVDTTGANVYADSTDFETSVPTTKFYKATISST